MVMVLISNMRVKNRVKTYTHISTHQYLRSLAYSMGVHSQTVIYKCIHVSCRSMFDSKYFKLCRQKFGHEKLVTPNLHLHRHLYATRKQSHVVKFLYWIKGLEHEQTLVNQTLPTVPTTMLMYVYAPGCQIFAASSPTKTFYSSHAILCSTPTSRSLLA